MLTSVTVEVPLALGRPLDYLLPEGRRPPPLGSVVEVHVGSRKYPAVVVSVQKHGGERSLKPLGEEIASPLAEELRELCRFVSHYYHCTLGVAYGLATPSAAAPAPALRGWQLTAAGRSALGELPPRQRLARQLAAQVQAEGLFTLEQAGACSASARRLLRDWAEKGWLEVLTETTSIKDRVGPLALGLPTLTVAQQNALATIDAAIEQAAVVLLHGVTGSGKTEVFLSAAARVIEQGRQALLLVPEINLTPQLTDRVRAALPDVELAILHSRVNPSERNRAWHAAHAGQAELVIGTRLAVFASLPRLGLIIVDEEHDGSYKQDEAPRYHARDLAVMRGRLARVPVLLASATPSLESWNNAQHGRYRLASLYERATLAALPRIELVPARGQRQLRNGGLSDRLLAALDERAARGEQSLILVNRRGYAPALYCPHCAWTAPCRHCDAKLTWHQVDGVLRCHHCGWQQVPPAYCPACGHPELRAVGIGTQRVEEALKRLRPSLRVMRADRDALSGRHAWQNLYRQVLAGGVDVLVGTQMLAKGHDFPKLTLVGVLEADRALFSTDFRAQEDLFALLTQVAGRAGRHALPGEVLVQTEFPDHSLYADLRAGDYAGFAARSLAEREALGLPPASRMAIVRAEAKRGPVVEEFFAYAHGLLRAELKDGRLYPPQPAPLARKADVKRWMMTLIAPTAKALQTALARLVEALRQQRPAVKWTIDVDPYDFG